MPPNMQMKAKMKRRKKKSVEEEPYDESDPIKPTDSNEQAIKNATKLWDDIKRRVAEEPEFVTMKDHEKVEIYQKSKFKEFYTSYPIVCRYMICMGQFSIKAFKRFLKKCESMSAVPQKRESGASEEQWVMRQADYVRYLWEAYQTQHFSATESKNIWKHAYETLQQEFKDFKDMHKEVEEKLKVDEKFNKSELVKELVGRIATEQQSLDDNSTSNLVQNLKIQVAKQRRRNLLQQIKDDVEKTIPSAIGRGTLKDPQSK